MYREEIMDHYKRPRNAGSLETEFEAEGENASCGDKVHVYAKVEGREIEEIKHETEGCAICIAATSILSQEMAGEKIGAVEGLDEDWILDKLGIEVSPMRLKCATLGLKTFQAALNQES